MRESLSFCLCNCPCVACIGVYHLRFVADVSFELLGGLISYGPLRRRYISLPFQIHPNRDIEEAEHIRDETGGLLRASPAFSPYFHVLTILSRTNVLYVYIYIYIYIGMYLYVYVSHTYIHIYISYHHDTCMSYGLYNDFSNKARRKFVCPCEV